MKRFVLVLVLVLILIVSNLFFATAATLNDLSENSENHYHYCNQKQYENLIHPTCATKGSYDEVSYCELCGIEMSREHIIVKETNTHIPAQPVKENEKIVNCLHPIEYDRVTYCSVCGKELIRTLIVTGRVGPHSYDDEEKIISLIGEKVKVGYTCQLCGFDLPTRELKDYDGNNLIFGDYNKDNKITSEDARLTLRYFVGLESDEDVDIRMIDVDKSGKIEPSDARLLLRASVGLFS